ncbi:MAG: GFA family protein [Pseudomonadota bacterium]
MLAGGCHCGAIRYEIAGEVTVHALCHCADCRRHAGAPMVGWAMVPEAALTVTGEPKVYASSTHGRRMFCAACGTGLFYANAEMLPGKVDIQSGTLNTPEALPPALHVQTAERLPWMTGLDTLPAFQRFPG